MGKMTTVQALKRKVIRRMANKLIRMTIKRGMKKRIGSRMSNKKDCGKKARITNHRDRN